MGTADAFRGSLDGRDDPQWPTVEGAEYGCGCVAFPAHIERCVLHAAAPDLLAALTDLRAACEEAYKAGRIPAEPFVRAGNVIAKATEESVSPLGLFATNRPQEDTGS